MADNIRLEKIAGVIGDLDHQLDANWDPDGKPALSVFDSLALDPPVTRAELDAIDPDYRRTVKFVTPIKEENETSIATAPPAVATPAPVDENVLRGQLKDLDAAVNAKTAVLEAARADLAKTNATRDRVVGTLAKVASDDLANLNKKIFATSDVVQAERSARLAKFQEVTGGAIPQRYASKLDERGANRRSIKRAAERMASA